MFADGCFIESMASLSYSWSQTSPVFVYEKNASRGYGRKRGMSPRAAVENGECRAVW